MTKAILEQIERQLSELDAEAMSFDHEEAEECKDTLVRIVDQAARISRRIETRSMQEVKQPPHRLTGQDRSIQQARDAMSRPGFKVIEGAPYEIAGGGKTVTKAETTYVRRSISVGKGNSDD